MLFLSLMADTGHAQPPDFHFRFMSRIVADDSLQTALRDCHIINKTQRLGTISDEFGNFTITANRKDSIEISALGYKSILMAAADSMFSNNRIIRLQPIAYPLREVDIGRFSTYDQFKRDLMAKEFERSSLKIDPINKYEISPRLLPGNGGINIPFSVSPVTYLYNLLSKEGKQLRYYQSLIDRTAEYIVIGEKFNGEIVGQLTGLQDDELIRFMSSCYFTKAYLLYVSQMEINREIMRKYRQYTDEKNGQQE
jgi:hypothetical protein